MGREQYQGSDAHVEVEVGGGAVRTIQHRGQKVVAQLESLFLPGVAGVINDVCCS